jgi:hypothetical protein
MGNKCFHSQRNATRTAQTTAFAHGWERGDVKPRLAGKQCIHFPSRPLLDARKMKASIQARCKGSVSAALQSGRGKTESAGFVAAKFTQNRRI